MNLPDVFIEALVKRSEKAKRPWLAASTERDENEGEDA